MESFHFTPYILIILAILAGVGGLTLLIIGLVQSKRSLWIPGIIVFLVAMIMGIAGIVISVKTIVTEVADNIENIDLKHKHKSHVYSDTLYNLEKPVDTILFAESISGFIEDSDNSQVYIKVFPKRDFVSYGITLEKVIYGKKSKEVHKAIGVLLNFNRDFTGKLKLTAFDYEKNELGESATEVRKKSGEIGNINFPFQDNVNFSAIDYCTLTNE